MPQRRSLLCRTPDSCVPTVFFTLHLPMRGDTRIATPTTIPVPAISSHAAEGVPPESSLFQGGKGVHRKVPKALALAVFAYLQ
jgi:hypothetical protein